MDNTEQTQALADDLQKLIHRYRVEFEMTAATFVGVLTFQSHLIMAEMQQRHTEEDPQD